MKTPVKSETLYNDTHAENPGRYQAPVAKKRNDGTEIKKNWLLTPFLLSIPVIIILFILIPASDQGIPNTVTAAPVEHDVAVAAPKHKTEQLNAAVVGADTLISNKTIALPEKK